MTIEFHLARTELRQEHTTEESEFQMNLSRSPVYKSDQGRLKTVKKLDFKFYQPELTPVAQ